MRKGKHVQKKDRRLNNFLFFYVILVVFTFVNYTFSKYMSTTGSTATVKVAKFNIVVNETTLGEAETFVLKSSADVDNPNAIDNKIAPDSEGFFEVTIDPNNTQVSLEYSLAFDLSKLIAEGKNIDLTKYSLDEGTTFIEMPADDTVTGDIILASNDVVLTSSDSVTIRVYWEWVQDITNPTFENTTIQVTSIVKQKVESENV